MFLLAYRNTPHNSTGQTPASLKMERKIRTKLPKIISPQHQPNTSQLSRRTRRAKPSTRLTLTSTGGLGRNSLTWETRSY